MRAFRFRLQTLLKLRESARDARREQYAQAQEAEKIIDDQQREIDDELNNAKLSTHKAVEPGTVDVDALLHANQRQRVLLAQQATLREQAKTIAQAIHQRREALMEADREVKVLEKLRERQKTQFQHEQHRIENKQMDEIAQRVRTIEHETVEQEAE